MLHPRPLTIDFRRHPHPGTPRPSPISRPRTSECQDWSPCSWWVLWLHRCVLAPWARSPLGQCRSSWVGLTGAWGGCGPRASWGPLGPIYCSPCFSAFFEGLQARGEGPSLQGPHFPRQAAEAWTTLPGSPGSVLGLHPSPVSLCSRLLLEAARAGGPRWVSPGPRLVSEHKEGCFPWASAGRAWGGPGQEGTSVLFFLI